MAFTICLEERQFRGRYHFAVDSASGGWRVAREEADLYERDNDYVVEELDEEGGEPRFVERIRHVRKNMIRDAKGNCEYTEWDRIEEEGEDNLDIDSFYQHPGLFDRAPEKRSVRAPQPDELGLNMRLFWEFGALRSRLTNFQVYSIFPNTLRIPQDPSNETFLVPEGRNLASVFKRMRRSSQGVAGINQITEAMQSIMPNLERISVLTVGGYLVPQFHVVEPSGRRHVFNVSQLSDGTLRVLGLLTALYQVPKPTMIGLEEPEQTVNPGILTVLADSVKEVARRTQIFITTHSPNFLDHFDPSSVKTVELIGGRTRVENVSPRQIEAVKERLFTLGELLAAEGLHG